MHYKFYYFRLVVYSNSYYYKNVKPDILFHDKKILMTIEQRGHLEMAFHRVQSTRGLVQTGLHLRSARFDSTQQGHHMT